MATTPARRTSRASDPSGWRCGGPCARTRRSERSWSGFPPGAWPGSAP